MHPPPGGCTEVLATRDFHLARQLNGNHVVGRVGGVPDGDSGRGRHRDGREIRVCAEFFRHGDSDTISSTVTLEEGQGD